MTLYKIIIKGKDIFKGASIYIVMSGSNARRTECRNRSVHRVHEDFEQGGRLKSVQGRSKGSFGPR